MFQGVERKANCKGEGGGREVGPEEFQIPLWNGDSKDLERDATKGEGNCETRNKTGHN